MHRLLISCTLLLAQPVLGDCPTSDDLAAGIRFQVRDVEGVSTDTYRMLDNGLIEASYEFEPGSIARAVLAQGVYLIESVTTHDGVMDMSSRYTYSFPIANHDLPNPIPGGIFNTRATVFNLVDGIRAEPQDYTFGELTEATYGACTYAMIPIVIAFPEDEGNFTEVLHYLPDLGLSYLAETKGTDHHDIYPYFNIESLE